MSLLWRMIFFQSTSMPPYESRISLSKMLIEVEEYDVSVDLNMHVL